jgi:hypothetical protein
MVGIYMKHPKTGMTHKIRLCQDSLKGGVKDFRALRPVRSFASKSSKNEKNDLLAARSAHLRTSSHLMDPPHGRRSLFLGRYPEVCIPQSGSGPFYKTGFPAARVDCPFCRHHRDHRRPSPACRAFYPDHGPLVYHGNDRRHSYHQDRGISGYFTPAPPARAAQNRFLGRPA